MLSLPAAFATGSAYQLAKSVRLPPATEHHYDHRHKSLMYEAGSNLYEAGSNLYEAGLKAGSKLYQAVQLWNILKGTEEVSGTVFDAERENVKQGENLFRFIANRTADPKGLVSSMELGEFYDNDKIVKALARKSPQEMYKVLLPISNAMRLIRDGKDIDETLIQTQCAGGDVFEFLKYDFELLKASRYANASSPGSCIAAFGMKTAFVSASNRQNTVERNLPDIPEPTNYVRMIQERIKEIFAKNNVDAFAVVRTYPIIYALLRSIGEDAVEDIVIDDTDEEKAAAFFLATIPPENGFDEQICRKIMGKYYEEFKDACLKDLETVANELQDFTKETLIDPSVASRTQYLLPSPPPVPPSPPPVPPSPPPPQDLYPQQKLPNATVNRTVNTVPPPPQVPDSVGKELVVYREGDEEEYFRPKHDSVQLKDSTITQSVIPPLQQYLLPVPNETSLSIATVNATFEIHEKVEPFIKKYDLDEIQICFIVMIALLLLWNLKITVEMKTERSKQQDFNRKRIESVLRKEAEKEDRRVEKRIRSELEKAKKEAEEEEDRKLEKAKKEANQERLRVQLEGASILQADELDRLSQSIDEVSKQSKFDLKAAKLEFETKISSLIQSVAKEIATNEFRVIDILSKVGDSKVNVIEQMNEIIYESKAEGGKTTLGNILQMLHKTQERLEQLEKGQTPPGRVNHADSTTSDEEKLPWLDTAESQIAQYDEESGEEESEEEESEEEESEEEETTEIKRLRKKVRKLGEFVKYLSNEPTNRMLLNFLTTNILAKIKDEGSSSCHDLRRKLSETLTEQFAGDQFEKLKLLKGEIENCCGSSFSIFLDKEEFNIATFDQETKRLFESDVLPSYFNQLLQRGTEGSQATLKFATD